MADPAESPACQSIEHEMSVLGSMMLSQRAAEEMAARLEPPDFFRPAHQEIFKALCVMVKAGKPCTDFEMVRTELGSRLEHVGGWEYLTEVATFCPSPVNCHYYADVVIQKADKRRAVSIARQVARCATGDALPDDLYQMMQSYRPRGMQQPVAVEHFNGVFKPIESSFLWEPYWPKGKCILFDADGGVGKSALSLALAACLSRGITPITGEPCEPVRTLYLHKGEDQSAELETVYRANGGVPGSIDYLDHRKDPLVLNDRGLQRLERTITDGGYALGVFDAFFYFLHGLVKDTNDNMAALRVMEGLNSVASATQCTFESIRHTTKGIVGKAASDLGMGSVQYRNSHRGQLLARYHPERRGLIIVQDEKGSILVPRGEPFAFERRGNEILFVPEFDNPFSPNAPDAKGKVSTAIDLISEMCDHQFVSVPTVVAKAEALGISVPTLNRARAAMTKAGILSCTKSSAVDGQWMLYVKGKEDYDPWADS